MACDPLFINSTAPVTSTCRKQASTRSSSCSSRVHFPNYGSRTSSRRSLPNCCNIRSSTTKPKSKNGSVLVVDIFNFQFSTSLLPSYFRSFVFDHLLNKKEINQVEENDNVEIEQEGNEVNVEEDEELKRANWVERVIELQQQWRSKEEEEVLKSYEEHSIQEDNKDCDGEGAAEDANCKVEYDDDDAAQGKIEAESFQRLLSHVSLSETKLFAQLAFLSNKAYEIPDIKPDDLRRYYGLDFVTSSLIKKAEAAALKMKLDQDSANVPLEASESTEPGAEEKEKSVQKYLSHPSVAYDIAASAASYIHSRAKDILTIPSKSQLEVTEAVLHDKGQHQKEEKERTPSQMNKLERHAYVAASTMTAVVAADEKQKLEAARDLQALHSSPCEWFVCDDSSSQTRCFVIQGSDSLASWKANLFFEPTEFEGTDVLVHRGIYEAAKGIYEQFMPEITQHLERYEDQAKFQFTGHSLGGSLSLLVHLMLLSRGVLKPSFLLPVVTFGSPFVFCGGQKVLDKLGVDEDHIHCVIMHRDIVPRAFSCNYPDHVAKVLKRLNSTFRSHPCLNKNRLLYSPMGTIFILQPDEKSSPAHPFLPPGNALYALKNTYCAGVASALGAFINTPHPLETLSDPTAYGSGGAILRDHDSSNYHKAVNTVTRKSRKQRNRLWQLIPTKSSYTWSNPCTLEERLARKEPTTGV